MKSLTILSGKAIIMELPEINGGWQTVYRNDRDKNGLLISDEKEHYDKWGENSNPRFVFGLPPGTWQIVGMLTEVTADDVAALTGQYYNKYNERYVHYPSASTRVTPIEDIESAILAEGYHLDVNPIPEPNLGEGVSDDWITDYNNAQSRVLCRERCLVLRRADG